MGDMSSLRGYEDLCDACQESKEVAAYVCGTYATTLKRISHCMEFNPVIRHERYRHYPGMAFDCFMTGAGTEHARQQHPVSQWKYSGLVEVDLMPCRDCGHPFNWRQISFPGQLCVPCRGARYAREIDGYGLY